MIKKILGKIHGRMIELEEDPGMSDGQTVEVEVKISHSVQQSFPEISEGLAKVYEILSRRYSSGHSDTAERHSEHQP